MDNSNKFQQDSTHFNSISNYSPDIQRYHNQQSLAPTTASGTYHKINPSYDYSRNNILITDNSPQFNKNSMLSPEIRQFKELHSPNTTFQQSDIYSKRGVIPQNWESEEVKDTIYPEYTENLTEHYFQQPQPLSNPEKNLNESKFQESYPSPQRQRVQNQEQDIEYYNQKQQNSNQYTNQFRRGSGISIGHKKQIISSILKNNQNKKDNENEYDNDIEINSNNSNNNIFINEQQGNQKEKQQTFGDSPNFKQTKKNNNNSQAKSSQRNANLMNSIENFNAISQPVSHRYPQNIFLSPQQQDNKLISYTNNNNKNSQLSNPYINQDFEQEQLMIDQQLQNRPKIPTYISKKGRIIDRRQNSLALPQRFIITNPENPERDNYYQHLQNENQLILNMKNVRQRMRSDLLLGCLNLKQNFE